MIPCSLTIFSLLQTAQTAGGIEDVAVAGADGEAVVRVALAVGETETELSVKV